MREIVAALRPLLLFLLCCLLLLSASRVGLMLWQWPRVVAVEGALPVLLSGLRFDLALMGWLVGPLAAATPLLATTACGCRAWHRLLRPLLTALFLFLLFMELATPPFIDQYDVRPHGIFIEYLIYPREVLATLWGGYRLELLVAAVALPLAGWRLHRLLRPRAPRGFRLVWWKALPLAPLLFLLFFLLGRSTLAHHPLNPGMAAFSTDPLVNDLGLNSTYSVLNAAWDLYRERRAEAHYGDMEEAEVIRRVRANTGLPLSAFDDPTRPTLHWQRATTPRQRPLNLVIVLEESLGAEFVGALNGASAADSLTPRLDALSREGRWFTRMYATGTRSVRGIEALITGFTPSAKRSVVKLSGAQQRFFTLARLLGAHGYRSDFIYGGESHFDNMRSFFLNNGFQRVIDQDDFDSPRFRGAWGVSDEDIFARAHRELLARSADRERPFFTLIFTTSNHAPFEYPEGRIEPRGAQPQTVENAVRYADHALGEFIRTARAAPYWSNTLFLIVADHNSRVYGPALIPLDRFHIPALILGGGTPPGRVDALASQIDLPPTLLSLMGLSTRHPMIGRDLTRPELRAAGRAIVQYNAVQGYLRGDRLAVLQERRPPRLFAWRDGALTEEAATDEELMRDALAHALWSSLAYEKGYYRSDEQRSGPAQRSAPAQPFAPAQRAVNGPSGMD